MRPRKWPWLVGAALLFLAAAIVMSLGDAELPQGPGITQVEFPRSMGRAERNRMEGRRTLPPPSAPVPAPAAVVPIAPYQRPRDPVLAALPSSIRKGALVVEANALTNSPVGRLLIDCLMKGRDGKGLAQLQEKTGIDPLRDLDRVMIMDDTLVLSGHFGAARWDEVFSAQGGTAYGERGRVFGTTLADGGVSPERFGVWGDQLLVMGRSEDELRAVIDRIEGRGPPDAPIFDEKMTYGEIYGVLSAEQLARLLPQEQAAVAERIRSGAGRVELHVDTTHDVGIVADVQGFSDQDTEDVGRSLGAALAMGRLKAQSEGNGDLAEILDLARVKPGRGTFRAELGLPLELLRKRLEHCGEEDPPDTSIP